MSLVRHVIHIFKSTAWETREALLRVGLSYGQADRVLLRVYGGIPFGDAVAAVIKEDGSPVLCEDANVQVYDLGGGRQAAVWTHHSEWAFLRGRPPATCVEFGKFAEFDESKGEWVLTHKPWEEDMK